MRVGCSCTANGWVEGYATAVLQSKQTHVVACETQFGIAGAAAALLAIFPVQQ
jgi:hypothetical protein